MSESTPPPAYQQVKSAVCAYIDAQRLKPGDRLPTEAQLCAELGFSRPTVNRALSELQWEGVVERVQGSGTFVAHRQPHTERWRVMVSGGPGASGVHGDPYWATLLSGIQAEAAALAVDVNFHCEGAAPPIELLKEPPGVSGVLSAAFRLDDAPGVLRLHQAGVPTVGIALRPTGCRVPAVCTDNYGGTCQAVRHLSALGHRRIGFATGYIRNADVMERLLGFHHAMAEARLRVDPSSLFLADGPDGLALLEEWWESLAGHPTALLVADYLVARLIRQCDRQGVRVPQDISLVLVDDHWGVKELLGSPAVVRQPIHQLGRRAMRKLVSMMRGDDDGTPEVLPTEFAPGSTVAPPKGEPGQARPPAGGLAEPAVVRN